MERWKCVLGRSPRSLGTGWLLARGDVTVKPADTRKGKQAEAKHLELEKGGGRERGREGFRGRSLMRGDSLDAEFGVLLLV